jgi:hypothetical protein
VDVRLAKYDDITSMVLFMKTQHDKSILAHIPFNPALLRKNLREIIKGANGDILLAVNNKGRIRGCLIAWHEAMLFTHQKLAVDIHFLAEQGGDMLLRAFKRWAKDKGCFELCMGTFTDHPPTAWRINNLYMRQGLKQVGMTYRMEL